MDKCAHWEICQDRERQLRDMIEKTEQRNYDMHERIWAAIDKTNNSVAKLAASIGTINGRLAGYLVAAAVVAAVIQVIAAKVF